MGMQGFQKKFENQRVSEAVGSWERVHPTSERLSGEARGRILREATRRDVPAEQAFRSLFLPRWSVLLASLAPLALIGVLVSQVGWKPAESDDLARIQVAKVDGEVVFTIQNGGRPHTVARSTSPDRFESASTIAVLDGSYSDRLEGTANLVFYRID